MNKLSDAITLKELQPSTCVMLVQLIDPGPTRFSWLGWRKWSDAETLVSCVMQAQLKEVQAIIRCRERPGPQSVDNTFIAVSIDEFNAMAERMVKQQGRKK